MEARIQKIAFFIFSCLVLFIIPSCSDDDNEIREKDLPLEIREFLNNFLPNNKIVSIQETESTTSETKKYELLLDGGVHADFWNDGTWISIAAENGMPESAQSLIWTNTLTQLKNKEPNAKITKITSFYGDKIIDLNTGKQYADCSGFENNHLSTILTPDELPVKIKDFFTRNSLENIFEISVNVRLTESKGDIYRIMFGNYMTLTFNENGEWIHGIDRHNYSSSGVLLQNIAVKELPESVISALNTSGETLGRIQEISCYKNNIFGIQFSTKSFLISKETGIIEPPVDAANKLAEKYFEPGQAAIPELIMYSPYDFSFVHKYDCGYMLYITMGINNDWKNIYCIMVSGGLTRYMELPVELISQELPEKIKEYLDKNYLQPKIYGVGFSEDIMQYGLKVDEKDMVFFDKNGNFIKKETI